MSIYCSRLSMDDDDDPTGLPSPIAYLGSHVRIQDDAWRYGVLDTAHIPPWCAAGVNAETFAGDEDGPPVPYFRLSVDGYDWRNPSRDASATVILDEQQVAALRDDLTQWLEAVNGLPALLRTQEADNEQP
ncbi:hypothetical protein [Nonomuraea typhae]|uniref:hypothetical protein n=1 Tax=Nonomuraea typhae TaxID=2603600 RepID=UPI0015E1C15D|nr:hypothetical protein [Nonomuraea typhae]